MIHDTHSEVPIWMIRETALKFRSKSYDSQNKLWSPNLNDKGSDSSDLKQWIILRHNGFTDLDFFKIHFTHHYLLFKTLQALSKFKDEWLFWSDFC